MNKNKNGFTLIELLVTIVIMLTILGIAIVSFVNVSKRKKIEAYEEVKEQMELAGEQYFENNRYLFEGLEDGSSGSISLGKLIDDGYLNKVTDPRDGKSFSYCTKIDVIIKDGVFDTEVNEGTYGASDNKTDCENDSSVEVTEPGAPKIEVTANGTKGDNDWYVSNVTIEAKADTNGNGTLKNLKRCETNGTNGCIDFNETASSKEGDTKIISDDQEYKSYCYRSENMAGKKVSKCVAVKVDKTPPTCETLIVDANDSKKVKGWYNIATGKPSIEFGAIDGMSGTDTSNYKYTDIKQGDNTYTSSKDFKDKAGNIRKKEDCKVQVKYDSEKPKCDIRVKTGTSPKKGNYANGNQWYKSEVTFELVAWEPTNVKGSGVINKDLAKYKLDANTITNNSHKEISLNGNVKNVKFYCAVKDEAGNVGSNTKGPIGVELGATLTFNSDKTDNSTCPKGNVFKPGVSGICKFGNKCSNIKTQTDEKLDGTKTKWHVLSGDEEKYFARACENVGAYKRYFNVDSISAEGIENGIDDDATDMSKKGMMIVKETKRYGCKFDGNYHYNSCGSGNGSRVNFTGHQYQYESPAGNRSNKIRLYVEYVGKCGY